MTSFFERRRRQNRTLFTAEGYYYGLPSRPSFVANTINEVWVLPAVGEHKIVELWEAGFADQVIARLSAMKVDWARLDAVRIGIVGESSAPVILWIGVVPESLSGENGRTVAFDARKVLYNCGIKDVEVEIRESRVFKSVSPKLLAPVLSSNSLVTFVDPLSVALGLPVCADKRRHVKGTGSFYIARSGVADKVFLPHHKVILLGDAAYKNLVASIMGQIGRKVMIAEHQEARRQMTEGREGEDVEDERAEPEQAIERFDTFYKEVVSKRANRADRILGRGFNVDSLGFTQDIAVIEVDTFKIDASNFCGNVIDLGTEIDSADFMLKMYPDFRNRTHFKYPADRLLRLHDTISVDETRRPQMVDQDGEKYIMVLKNGGKTGLPISRANGVISYIRYYVGNSPGIISKEWAILPADSKSVPFSALGDSGSIIVDGSGRIDGLLTGGGGTTETSDITYATPISFNLERLRAFGFTADFNLPFVT
ncbi:hypothetical protein BKA82DRAFT_4376803 [Pisolithus tinctorius]|nr:hypothetical protein BKA82DRAFT_4376803 [Pisolithus tinctorius]